MKIHLHVPVKNPYIILLHLFCDFDDNFKVYVNCTSPGITGYILLINRNILLNREIKIFLLIEVVVGLLTVSAKCFHLSFHYVKIAL